MMEGDIRQGEGFGVSPGRKVSSKTKRDYDYKREDDGSRKHMRKRPFKA